jgi:quercetin dioxygenase-like cupin family protein
MRNLTHIIVGVLLVTLTLVFATKPAMAQDVVKVAPEAYKVLLENDRVRVLEYRIKPEEKDAMHSHPDYIGYAFNSGKIKLTFPDGKTVVREFDAGKAIWLDAETHAVENVGATTAHGLLIELKEPQKK